MLKTIVEPKKIGVELRFEKENINTLSEDGELMLTDLSFFAGKKAKVSAEKMPAMGQ